MPKIGEVHRGGRETLEVPGLPLPQEALRSNLTKGGFYLIGGEPGIGKTTHAVRILAGLAKRGARAFHWRANVIERGGKKFK